MSIINITPFIIMYNKRPRLVAIKAVYNPEIRAVTGHMKIAGKLVGILTGTGKYDRSRISVHTQKGTVTMDANHAGVKKKIRRLRPEEAHEYDELTDQIDALIHQREELVKRAWQKGHAVTVKELQEQVKH